MSLDLSWALLDDDFTSHLRSTIDKVLSNASRPDFIGPIHLSALHLGNEAPEISIVDIGDVWQGFLDREEGQHTATSQAQKQHLRQAQQQQHLQQQHAARDGQNGGGFGGVGRFASDPLSHDQFAKFAEKNLPFTMSPEERMSRSGGGGGLGRTSSQRKHRSNRLQTYRQYSDSGNAQLVDTGSMSNYDPSVMTSIPPTPASSHWGPGLLPSDRPFSSHGNNPGGYFSAWQGAPPSASNRSSMPVQRPQTWRRSSASIVAPQHSTQSLPAYPNLDSIEAENSQSTSTLPSLQLHLSLHWNTSSIRMTVNTSLLINHPSPAFMSLPLSITITGIVLQAGGLLAFDVDQATNARRGHFCLAVEEEEEEEDGDEEEREEEAVGILGQEKAANKRPVSVLSLQSKTAQTPNTGTGSGAFGLEQHISAGEKILSSVTLETSVGQADKHVLRNVAKVERFVVSLMRKAIGDELVFPNFYSIELP